MKLPMFSAWLAKEAGDPSKIIESAYSIRNNSEFLEIREQLREVKRLHDEVSLEEANKASQRIYKEIDKASNNLRVRYGIETRQGVPITKLMYVYNTIATFNQFPKLPNYNFEFKLPEFLYNMQNKKGFGAVYRNISNDLSTVWALGEARDVLGSKIINSLLIFYNNFQHHVFSRYERKTNTTNRIVQLHWS
ncbi:MAG: hypothetical protein GY775_20445 [Candidatus Scalindua sp.]|nr:hypothetical protein [Candidatus Scalindua sp.]